MTAGPRRAPRLAPHDRLAALFTRRGRFATVDPARARPLPRPGRWLGVLAWAGFVVAVLWSARRGGGLPVGGVRATLAAPAR